MKRITVLIMAIFFILGVSSPSKAAIFNLQAERIPAPPYAVKIDQRNYSHQKANTEYTRYQSSSSVKEIFDFYLTRLNQAGWKLIQHKPQVGMLSFSKGNSYVNITAFASSNSSGTDVFISKGKVSLPKELKGMTLEDFKEVQRTGEIPPQLQNYIQAHPESFIKMTPQQQEQYKQTGKLPPEIKEKVEQKRKEKKINGDVQGRDLSWLPRYPGAKRILYQEDAPQRGCVTLVYRSEGDVTEGALDFVRSKMIGAGWSSTQTVRMGKIPVFNKDGGTVAFFRSAEGNCVINVNYLEQENDTVIGVVYLPAKYQVRY